MKVVVNGVEIPDAQIGLNVQITVDREEATGPVVIELIGGSLTIRNQDGAAVTINTNEGQLRLLGGPGLTDVGGFGMRPTSITDDAS